MSVERKPSETAVFAALHRAIAHKEMRGPDYLAEHFLPPHFRFFIKFKKVRANTKSKFSQRLPGLHEYMIARTVYFDAVFAEALNKKTPQIVLLGAGYDTRAYRFAALNSATKIIELDIAPTQASKRKLLKKAKIAIPEPITLIPINFNKESLKDVLEKAGYDNQKKTLFLWEGVSYYLEAESVAATLEFVSRAHHESVIAFDYAASISEANSDVYGVKEFLQTMKERHADERLMFAIDEGETESYLEQRGLKMIECLDNKEIERRFLGNEDGALIGQMTGHFRFALASSIN